MMATSLPSLASIAHDNKFDLINMVGEVASSSGVVPLYFLPSAQALVIMVPSFFGLRKISEARAVALSALDTLIGSISMNTLMS